MKEKTNVQENLSLIDTDILIFILKNNKSVIEKSQEYQQKLGRLKISDLTFYECLRGYKTSNATKKLEVFMKLTKLMDIIPLTQDIYTTASEIYSKLYKKGFPTGEFDLLIAATALQNDLTIVTNNTRHFIRIKKYFDLKINNWL